MIGILFPKHRILASALLLLVVLLIGSVSAAKKNRSAPHSHQGLLKPHTPGPFASLKLTKADLSTLTKGSSVMKQTMPKEGEEAGTVLCVQDIHAPARAVWHQILSLDTYKGKVPKVNACQNYQVSKNKDNTFTVKTKMVIGVMPGYSYENYYDHKVCPKHKSVVWSLDYDKTSDFDDVAGHWHVDELDESHTRVYYACDVQMKSKNMPKPILNYISKAALKQATSWVKKESEKNPDNTIPKPFDAAAFGLDNVVVGNSNNKRKNDDDDKENSGEPAAKKSKMAFFSRN